MPLQQLNEGGTVYVQGSAKAPYKIRKIAGVVDCSCPAWRNLGGGIDTRICKHIKANIDPNCLPAAALARAGMSGGKAAVASALSTSAGSGKTSTALAPVVGQLSVRKTEKVVPALLLAQTWTDEDPTGWWMSEKLDGVRALWDGTKFITREGNEFVAPESFRKSMPSNVYLDGEIWLSRGMFQTTLSYVRKMVPDRAEWETLQFVVFDAPRAFGKFEDRQDYLKKLHAGRGSRYWRVLEQQRCHGREHLDCYLADVVSQKGEGVMLREFGSKYETDRSWTLLKVKMTYDAEAVVIGYDSGKGKHKGRVGALICKMPNGGEFNVGTGLTDRERENPPKVGTKITYGYKGLTDAGLPRHPSFMAVRDYE